MQFLYPTFLWALLALAIPVIIHLFAFRRFKTVKFTNVRFLQEIKEETSNRSKLKNLLILLMRLLAVACLVLAFAQPFIPVSDTVKTGNNTVSIFIDNSFSMDAQLDETPLIDVAKAKAVDIIKAYSEEDQFQVLTHDFEGRHQRLVSRQDALSLVADVTSTPQVKTVEQIYNRQRQITSLDNNNEIVYILSDFQESILPSTLEDAYRIVSDTTVEVNLIPIQSVIEQNISIDSAWLDAPVPLLNQVNNLLVRITNHSSDDAEGIRLSVIKDGQSKPEGRRTIPAGGYVVDTVSITLLQPGSQHLELKIDDYPVQFDDTYHLTLDIADQVNVLAITESNTNKYLSAVFQGLNNYELQTQNIGQLRYADFGSYDLIILSDVSTMSTGLSSELVQYIRTGGNVLLFPGVSAMTGGVNQFLQDAGANTLQSWSTENKQVSVLDQEDYLFKNVFDRVSKNLALPSTSGQYELTDYQSRGGQKTLRYRDGSPYLARYTQGGGTLYLCASPIDVAYNNLVLQAEVFVPMIYKGALSNRRATKLQYTIGGREAIELNTSSKSSEELYRISGAAAFIPGQSNVGDKVLLDVANQITSAGVYDLSLGETFVKKLAFNYDRRESPTAIYSGEDLENLFGDRANIVAATKDSDFSQLIGEKDKGRQLWRWFLIACLIFLAIETALLRFMKATS